MNPSPSSSDSDDLLIFATYVSRSPPGASATTERVFAQLAFPNEGSSAITQTESQALRLGARTKFFSALRVPRSVSLDSPAECGVFLARDPSKPLASLALAALEGLVVSLDSQGGTWGDPFGKAVVCDLSNGDALEFLAWREIPSPAIRLQRLVARGFRFPEAPRAPEGEEGARARNNSEEESRARAAAASPEPEYDELSLHSESPTIFASEALGELPCAYSHRVPAQYVEARLLRLETDLAAWGRVAALCRAAQVKFSSREEAQTYGFFSCRVSDLRIRGLSAELHKTSTSSRNSLPSPFVAVSARSRGEDWERDWGRTNTEYRTQSPMFGTNMNSSSGCEHAHPNLTFVAGSHSGVSPESPTAFESYVKLDDSLVFQVHHERFSVTSGLTTPLIARGEYSVSALTSQLCSVPLESVHADNHKTVAGTLEFRLEIVRSSPSTNPFDELEAAENETEAKKLPSSAYRKVPLSWLEGHMTHQRKVQSELSTMLDATKHRLGNSSEDALELFKSSRFKPDKPYGINPTNLHTSEFRFGSRKREEDELRCETKPVVTVGVPSAHVLGLAPGQGLADCEATLRTLESSAEIRAFVDLGVAHALLKLDEDPSLSEEFARRAPMAAELPLTATSPLCSASCERRDLHGACVVHAGPRAKRPASSAASSASTPQQHSTSAVAFGKSAMASIASRFSGQSQAAGNSASLTNKSQPGDEASMQRSPGLDAVGAPREAPPLLLAGWQRLASLETTLLARRAVVVAQALPAVVAVFVHEASLRVAASRSGARFWGRQLGACGLLVGWESLVSTYGSENVMLSDTIAAARYLTERVGLRVTRNRLGVKYTDADAIFTVLVESETTSLIDERVRVVVELAHGVFDALFGDEGGVDVALSVALFTQGVNEKQSLANYSLDATGFLSQKSVNVESANLVKDYHDRVLRWFHSLPPREAPLPSSASNPFDRLPDAAAESDRDAELELLGRSSRLLTELYTHVHASRDGTKDLPLLLLADRAVRAMRGGRIVSCKSAKDRTAMSVTLENARAATGVYWDPLQVGPAAPDAEVAAAASDARTIDVANVMREFGVRIEVAIKCVGVRAYSFNAFQRLALPNELRPPTSVILSVADSIKKRDLS